MTPRPFEAIVGDGVTLRGLERADLPLTLAWRNHPDSRTWFLDSGLITQEGHASWFDGYLRREDDQVFILERGGVPVAQVALSRIDPVRRTAEFGRLLVAPDERGTGLSHLATELCIVAAEQLGLHELVLEVKATNARAIRAYERAGFVTLASRDGDVVTMNLRIPEGSAEEDALP